MPIPDPQRQDRVPKPPADQQPASFCFKKAGIVLRKQSLVGRIEPTEEGDAYLASMDMVGKHQVYVFFLKDIEMLRSVAQQDPVA